jgi:hypothetical protein
MDFLAVGMLVIIFTIILGLLLSKGQVDAVKANWSERRCEPGVMFAGFMYKPDDNPKSAGEFAIENFQFCMKSLVKKVIEELMQPIYSLFGGVVAGAKSAGSSMNGIRTIMGNVAGGFSNVLEGFMGVYRRGMMQAVRTAAQLKMAYNRMLGVVLSMFYAGLSSFFAGLNMMSFVIKVVMIILGILLGLVIILIFVLFPFMPIIMSVIAVLISVVAVFTGVIGSEINGMANGFCFAGDVLVKMKDDSEKPISEIKLGDLLHENSKVMGVLKFNGNNVELFNYKGIKVSGEHLVYCENRQWMKIIDTNSPLAEKEEFIYSLVTENNRIPIMSDKANAEPIIFADWEEFSSDNLLHLWHTKVQDALHIPGKLRRGPNGAAHVGGKTIINVNGSPLAMSSVSIGDYVDDYDQINGQKRQAEVIGIYETNDEARGLLSAGIWKWENGYWHQGAVREGGFRSLMDNGKRYHLITSTGTFLVSLGDASSEYLVRDFTEMGVTNLKINSSMVVDALNNLGSL